MFSGRRSPFVLWFHEVLLSNWALDYCICHTDSPEVRHFISHRSSIIVYFKLVHGEEISTSNILNTKNNRSSLKGYINEYLGVDNPFIIRRGNI